MSTEPGQTTCAACGATASGNFCSSCGATLAARQCARCQATLSPAARFCHRCGTPAAGGPRPPAPGLAPMPAGGSRTPWMVAGGLIVALLALIVYKVWTDGNGQPAGAAAAPQMSNVGAAPGAESGNPGMGGPAPDISRMTPRERFDRLFNRVMTAAERGDTATVNGFTPMALGAYQQLDTVDTDARYHAAVLLMQTGAYPAALALADTILAEQPNHLFAYVIRGSVATLRRDEAALARARRDFIERFPAESASARVEYLEHQPVLNEFKREARQQ
jgi:hypothetical protein